MATTTMGNTTNSRDRANMYWMAAVAIVLLAVALFFALRPHETTVAPDTTNGVSTTSETMNRRVETETFPATAPAQREGASEQGVTPDQTGTGTTDMQDVPPQPQNDLPDTQ